MAAGEIYLRSSTPNSLYFRNERDVETRIVGSAVTTTGVSYSAREMFARVVNGIPYLYWSVDAVTVYRAQMKEESSSSFPEREIWISSGPNTYLLNFSYNGKRWVLPNTSAPTKNFVGYSYTTSPISGFPNRVSIFSFYELDNGTCTSEFDGYCNNGVNFANPVVNNPCAGVTLYTTYFCI